MTHLIRITKTTKFKVAKNDSGLRSELFKGLFLALLIHLALFLVFRIVTLPNLDTIAIIAPINVEIDLSTGEIDVLPLVSENPFSSQKLEPYPIDTLAQITTVSEEDFLILRMPVSYENDKVEEAVIPYQSLYLEEDLL